MLSATWFIGQGLSEALWQARRASNTVLTWIFKLDLILNSDPKCELDRHPASSQDFVLVPPLVKANMGTTPAGSMAVSLRSQNHNLILLVPPNPFVQLSAPEPGLPALMSPAPVTLSTPSCLWHSVIPHRDPSSTEECGDRHQISKNLSCDLTVYCSLH